MRSRGAVPERGIRRAVGIALIGAFLATGCGSGTPSLPDQPAGMKLEETATSGTTDGKPAPKKK